MVEEGVTKFTNVLKKHDLIKFTNDFFDIDTLS